jgi:tetratricopeptide (TPR) repeat protein
MPRRAEPRPPVALRRLAPLALAALLAACGTSRHARDDEPTIATLKDRRVTVVKDTIGRVDPDRAIAAYRALADNAPDAPQRPEVLRRLADLEVEKVETRIADGRAAGTRADWQDAVRQYRALLEAYPKAPGNDRVLYQLARAHEQGGDLDDALVVLDRLVTDHPASPYIGEAQFRRGELLFTARAYPRAEDAYARVLAQPSAKTLHERSLYMKGWSQFKQARLDEALASFFLVLDAKLEGHGDDDAIDLADMKSLPRADRELLEDTFRVMGLTLQNLKGGDSIAAHATTPQRRAYEFRVHHQLAALYLKQERFKDAADTLGAFTRRSPLHAHAPTLQAKVIEIYEAAGFANLALEAKREHVRHYGVDSDYRRQQPQVWQEKAQALVKTHLIELARHHHALAQKATRPAAGQGPAGGNDRSERGGHGTQAAADVKEAVHWYRQLLDGFPDEKAAPDHRFLLAELLHDDGRLDEAAVEFERTAYGEAPFAHAADAGYAAVLDRVELARRAATTRGTAGSTSPPAGAVVDTPAQRAAVQAQLRFAERFSTDARAAAVLTHAAETLHALRDMPAAAAAAQRVLDLQPSADAQHRRVALIVLAHSAFERGDFAVAEQRYAALIPLLPHEASAARTDITERHAASIYKQGEAARDDGSLGDAARHFARVADVAPGSSVRANAQFDAAATLVAAKDWAGAARQFEDFRARFPNHPLAAEVPARLAVVYTEQARWGDAAVEFERLAQSASDRAAALDVQWHAAQLHEKSQPASKAGAARAFERFVAMPGADLARATEARSKLMAHARDEGQAARALAIAQDLVRIEAAGGDARTARTRTLAAHAALALAQPAFDAYRQVALVEPLKKQLETKRSRMKDVLDAYARASDAAVPQAVTAATFHTAELYRDFGRALLASQRPKKLKKLELEQYEVLLEEQAFPFEEKAIELHEANARRAADGLYDESVQKSFGALRELRPARWAKVEKLDTAPRANAAAQLEVDAASQALTRGRVDEAVSMLTSAAQRHPDHAPIHNLLGVAKRQTGDFGAARAAYERALAIDAGSASAALNLGILHDLYLGDAARAAELYAAYLALTPSGDGAVTKWLAELKNRKAAPKLAATDNTIREAR